MKWFKHFSDAADDETLSALKDRFGMEGYGVWWAIVEAISKQIHDGPKDFTEYSVKKWREITGIFTPKLNKILEFLCENTEESPKLLYEFYEKKGIKYLKIRIPKILEMADEYTKKRLVEKQKSGQTPDKLQKKSGETPENIHSDKIRLDKSIKEEKNDAPSLPESKKESEALDHIMKHYNKAYPELPKLAGKQIVAWRCRARDWFHVGMFSGVSEDEIHERIDKCPVPKHFEILPREAIDKAKKATRQGKERAEEIDRLLSKYEEYERIAVDAREGKKRARSWRKGRDK